MSLHEQIKNNIKEALKAGDKVRLEVMRSLVTAFTNELVATSRTPQEFLTDEETMAVINRGAKQRKDSIEQFTKGKRMDLVEIEKEQLIILEEFLPKLMEKSDIEKFVKEKYESFENKDNRGMFIGYVMKELKGKADGNLVKETIDRIFV